MHVWGPVSVRRLSKRRKQSAVEEDPADFLWLYVYRCTQAWADTWTHTHTHEGGINNKQKVSLVAPALGR